MITLLTLSSSGGSLIHLLILFLGALIAILVLAGLIWSVEQWIIGAALPQPVRLVIGLILIIILIILFLQAVGLWI